MAGIEFGQLFVQSRFADVTDLMTGTLGVAIGVFGSRLYAGRSTKASTPNASATAWLMAAGVFYALVVLAILWSPYDFDISNTEAIRQRLSIFFGVPLSRAA